MSKQHSRTIDVLRRILFGATCTGVAFFFSTLGEATHAVAPVSAACYAQENEDLIADLDLSFTTSNAESDNQASMVDGEESNDEPTDSRVNINVDATTDLTLNSSTYAYGLNDAKGATTITNGGTIAVTNGATAYLDVLDEESTVFGDSISGVTLTVSDAGRVVLGQENDASQGFLIVAGASDSSDSALILNANSNLFIGSGGLLEIGAESGAGLVQVDAQAQLFNLGTSQENARRGVVVYSNGQVTIGSQDNLSTGAALDGDGEFLNRGVVSIYNAPGAENRAYFGVYTDNSTAKLTATGAVMMNGGSGADGLLTIAGALQAEEWSTLCNATFADTASVEISQLATLGGDNNGANLTIASETTRSAANVVLGGLRIYGEDAETGNLTLEKTGRLQITGLSTKFDDAGTATSTGRYDVYLDGGMSLNGYMYASASEDGTLSSTSLTTLGVRWNDDSSISEDGGLYASRLYLSVGASDDDKSASLTSGGTFYVSGTMSVNLENTDSFFEFVNTAVASKGTTIGTWDLGKGQILTNGVAEQTSTTASMRVTNLTVSGGQVNGYGASSLTATNLTINADANEGESYAVHTLEQSTISVNKLDLQKGLVLLESSQNAGGLKFTSDSSVITIGKADQAEDDFAQMQIMGVDATFGAGTINLAGQGALYQEAGYTLTFDGTTVVNSTQSSAQALGADTIVFKDSASYSGGHNVRAKSMIFQDGSDLNLVVDSPLTLSEGANLTLESGSVMNVEFSEDAYSCGKVVLSGDGVANLQEGSLIKISNLLDLEDGTYSNLLVQTDSDKSVFSASTESRAFYNLSTEVSEDGTDLLLNLSVRKNSTIYAKNKNQTAIAQYVDQLNDAQNLEESLQKSLETFLALPDETSVSNALQTIAGAQHANAINLAMNSPWRQAFNHLGNGAGRGGRNGAGTATCKTNYATYRGQAYELYNDGYYAPAPYLAWGQGSQYAQGYSSGTALLGNPSNVWFSSTYRGVEARADGVSDGFDISDVGMNLGYEAFQNSGWIGGLVFGYAQPKLTSHDTRIHASNFQLGAYAGGQLFNAIDAKFYIGGGLQDYTSKRTLNFGEQSEFHRANYDGQSLAVALNLSKPFAYDAWTTLRPVVQIDMQQAWLDEAVENGDGMALRYDSADWNQIFARAGVEMDYNVEYLLFSARALYGYMISGDAAPTMNVQMSGANTTTYATVTGLDQGDSFIEAGVSAGGYLDCERRWAITAGYDFLTSDKTTSHMGSVGTTYSF
ncbi:MAG: autotransporter outer membrane beta-barrel domain-containing protein [Planctomycetia bacterium]|nr:autotransporter outer membrane beta-barrel domain-containing protein [Planctomycetia bacterium]